MNNDQIWNKVLRFIGLRERSEKEIREYIKNKLKVNAEEEIETTIQRLKDLDFLNEARLVKAFVHDSVNLRNLGRQKIKFELQKKGVSESLIDQYLNQATDNEDQMATDFAKKRYAHMKNQPILTIKRRLFGQLVRRGFSTSVAMAAIEKVVKKQ